MAPPPSFLPIPPLAHFTNTIFARGGSVRRKRKSRLGFCMWKRGAGKRKEEKSFGGEKERRGGRVAVPLRPLAFHHEDGESLTFPSH